jgi:hypothetical protein
VQDAKLKKQGQMLQKSCISLAGRHRPVGMPNAQSQRNTRQVALSGKRDHYVNSNEEGFFKTNFPNASSVALPLIAVALLSRPAAAIAR